MKPMSFDFRSRRSMVAARRGMVGTSSPLAAQAGLAVLRAGGNAADAAIAAAAVLNVVEPASTGIGGDCFALYYDAKTRQVSALNASGRAPAALTADYLRGQGMAEIPLRSPHAITVPGAVSGWEALLARHGRMTLRDVLADAIYYARDGFPVGPVFARSWSLFGEVMKSVRYGADYLPNGQTPKAGQVVQLPGMARTLQAIAEGGAAAFYSGPTADQIVETAREHGSLLEKSDLAAHAATWDTPISTDYRGITVYECPPNGQGIVALIALNIAEGWNLGDLPADSPERLHLSVEAMRLAFADARQYVADPAQTSVPAAGMLDKAYAAERRGLIRPGTAMQPPSFGQPLRGSDTVYLTTADGEGNACSFINSLYYGFGSLIAVKDGGFFLQNRGAGFSLTPGHPNELMPGKRPYHTIIPGLATRDDQLWASFGVMGGFMQPQGHFQVLSAMIDDDLNPQESLDRPRWCLEAGTDDSILALEEGIPVASMAALAQYGHRVRPVSGAGRGVFGDGHIIRRDPDSGVLFGGSDPRKDGQMAAF